MNIAMNKLQIIIIGLNEVVVGVVEVHIDLEDELDF